jgi:predicted dehydrogenase
VIDRLLVVGSGSMGQRHVRTARGLLPAADIRVLRHRPGGDTPADANGCLKNLNEVKDFRPQAAVVANPAPYHTEVATELAKLGCHLLLEKPISHDLEGVDELVRETENRNLVLQIGYNLRFLPSLLAFQEHLQSGSLGRIFWVKSEVGSFLPDWRRGTDYRLGVSAQRAMGGGVLLELSHELDYLRWIFGEVTWVSAYAETLGDLQVDVEDTAFLTLGFRGTKATSGFPAMLAMDFLRRDSTRECHAIAAEGSLHWDGIKGIVKKFTPKQKAWEVLFDKEERIEDTYTHEWEHFLDCISSGSEPCAAAADGVAVLKILEAAKRSCRDSGKRAAISGEQV